MEDCAAAGKRLVVLDRPNPLGDRVEGGLLREEAASFVGGYPIPVCYGLTCGERFKITVLGQSILALVAESAG